MKFTVLKKFGVTIAFITGSLVISAMLYAMGEAGVGGALLDNVISWREQAAILAGEAALAGLVVDVTRYALAHMCPKDVKFSIPLGQVINRNLN